MQNWLSKAFLLVIGGLVVGGLAMAFWPVPVVVDFATAKPEDLLVTVDEDGKTRIREKYVVSAPLSGRLLRIDMDEGDRVEAGETLLAVIQPRDPDLLDARALAQAEARVAASETVLKNAEPALKQARLEAAHAEVELSRTAQAAKGGGATASDVDVAEMRYQHATEAVRAAIYSREIAAFELEQARAALIRSRPSEASSPNAGGERTNGSEIAIRSPITGHVLRVFQESAAVVSAGAPLLELGAPSDLEIEVDVLSNDAVAIEPGDRVLLEHWGGDRPLAGRVRLVEPAGFTKISTLGVEEQRVNVIIDLVDPPESRSTLGDGFRVEARIVTDEALDALSVPTNALFRRGEEWAVFREETGRACVTPVRIGRRNGLQAEVIEGLEEGDRVVVHPSDRVLDGVRIKQR